MGGTRTHGSVRCIACRMHQALCFCDLVPSLASRARFVFVLHTAERWKTTCTGRIAAMGVQGSELSYWVGRTKPFDPPVALGSAAVLFPPRPDEPPALDAAEWVTEIEERGLRPTIVVPDGTWAQCRKMVGRHDDLQHLPRLQLPEGSAPRGGLRAECLTHGMSTIDAVAWLLSAIDGPDAGAPMAHLHRTMLERTMASRGTPLPGGPTMADFPPLGHPDV